jgi:hypothetical protein
VPSQLAFAAHLGEEGANGESSKDSSDYMVVNRANGSRVTVYIRSVAAYKHIPWVCAMLANYTYNLPVAFISARSMAWRGSNRGNNLGNQRGMGLKLRRVSQIHIMYGVRNTTMVRNIVVRSLP